MAVILDSCVWISFFNIDDSDHEKALENFDELQKEGKKVILTEYILLEVVISNL